MNVLEDTDTIYILGSACKVKRNDEVIFGRYIGDSMISSGNDKVILFGTPAGSIMHVKQSDACFDLSIEDLWSLQDFEKDAIISEEWYHTNTDLEKLKCLGVFISPLDISPITISV